MAGGSARPRVGAVVAIYVAAGFLWILGSDPLGDYLAEVTAVPRGLIELGKGLASSV